RRTCVPIDDGETHAAASQLAREHQAGGSGADDQHVGVHDCPLMGLLAGSYSPDACFAALALRRSSRSFCCCAIAAGSSLPASVNAFATAGSVPPNTSRKCSSTQSRL